MTRFNLDPPWYRRFRGKWVDDVPLPGEEDDLLARHIKYAQLRDDHLNREETIVRDCAYVRAKYEMSCRHMRCMACPGPAAFDELLDDLDVWDWWLTRSA